MSEFPLGGVIQILPVDKNDGALDFRLSPHISKK